MSELHLSLLIIGLVFIAAVFAFNQWQERKYRRQTEKIFRGERKDALLDEPPKSSSEGRIEPSFGASSAANKLAANDEPPIAPVNQTVNRAPDPGRKIAGTSSPLSRSSTQTPAPVEDPVRKGLIDETVDLVGSLRPAQPVSAEKVQPMMARAQAFSKPVHWEGLVAGQWKEISAGAHYGELKIALQLADRRGAATTDDVSRFAALIKQFAVELDGSAQLEAEDSAIARAIELDAFCADVDVEIGVNLIANEQAIPATKLRALAEASGLKLSSDGVFHCLDEHGASQFTLKNSEPRTFSPEHLKSITTRGVTLLLDVPRVANGGQAFDRMLKLARHISDALGGEVVDDNHKPLTDAGAESIRRQLGLIYRQMDGYGIPAGGALALRLFS